MACSSTGGSVSSLYDCIKAVCTTSASLQDDLNDHIDYVDELQDIMAENGQAVKCVVNGSAGEYCTMPEGSVLPTLAKRLDELNACTVSGITMQSFLATAGQTVFTLNAAPANDYMIEVSLDGAICRSPADFIVSGTTLTLTHPALVNDNLDTRIFTV